MTTIILLLIAGAALAGLEVFVPGGILGVLAAVCVIAACVLSFGNYGLNGGLLTALAAVVLITLIIYVEIKILAKTGYADKIFLKTASTGHTIADGDQSLVGKPAKAVTTLAPTGMVEIEGKAYEAFCQDGHTYRGEKLSVIRVEQMRVIVGKETKPSA